MNDTDSRPTDAAAEAELAGVPEELLEQDSDKLGDALELLRGDLENAKQETLYAKAETQNVRRRLEKDPILANAHRWRRSLPVGEF